MKANSVGNKYLFTNNKRDFTYKEYVKVINAINLKFKEELLKGNEISLGHIGIFQIKKSKITDKQRFKKFFRFKNINGKKIREEIYTNPLEDYIPFLKWKKGKAFPYWKIKELQKFRKEIKVFWNDETGHKRYLEE